MSELQRLGMKVHLLSGDREENVLKVATAVGIVQSNVIAEATPESKATFVRSFGTTVVMVGDG